MKEGSIFDSYQAFNKWEVMEGTRVSESMTPSVYITKVKLKRVFKDLYESEIRGIFGKKRKVGSNAVQRYKETLIKKMECIAICQLFTALNIYLRNEDGELCGRYILACKKVKKDVEE